MSNRYIAAAMECRVGNPTKKLILIKLADNANDDGICWPSYATIARHCEVDKRTVIRHIKELEQMGIVSKKHRMTDKGNTSNYFQLSIPSKPLDGGDNLTLGGDAGVTRGVTSVSLGGCHPCHPEPSLEPSLEPSKVSQAKPDFSPVIDKWNSFAEKTGLQQLKGITTVRRKKIKSAYKLYKQTSIDLEREPRLKSESELAETLVDVAIATHTEFHLGKNDRGWRMNFDYLLQNKIVDRVTEHGSIEV